MNNKNNLYNDRNNKQNKVSKIRIFYVVKDILRYVLLILAIIFGYITLNKITGCFDNNYEKKYKEEIKKADVIKQEAAEITSKINRMTEVEKQDVKIVNEINKRKINNICDAVNNTLSKQYYKSKME